MQTEDAADHVLDIICWCSGNTVAFYVPISRSLSAVWPLTGFVVFQDANFEQMEEEAEPLLYLK